MHVQVRQWEAFFNPDSLTAMLENQTSGCGVCINFPVRPDDASLGRCHLSAYMDYLSLRAYC